MVEGGGGGEECGGYVEGDGEVEGRVGPGVVMLEIGGSSG